MHHKLIIGLFLLLSSALYSQPRAYQEYHDFDFWLGEWNVYLFGTDSLVGKSKIESIIDSVAILENYRALRSSYKGKSINKYDPQTKAWEQYWVDNGGLTLHLRGGLKDGKMVLENPQNRVIWTPLEGKRVRQRWEVNQGPDKGWQTVFDGEYRPRK